MAKESAPKSGDWKERFVRLSRDVHIGIGAIALIGVLIFPAVEILPTIAGLAFASAVVHEGLRHAVKGRSKSESKSQPVLQPA